MVSNHGSQDRVFQSKRRLSSFDDQNDENRQHQDDGKIVQLMDGKDVKEAIKQILTDGTIPDIPTKQLKGNFAL